MSFYCWPISHSRPPQHQPLQSFIRTNPKIWSCAFSTLIGCPSRLPGPMKNAISSSMSKVRHGPNTGGDATRTHTHTHYAFTHTHARTLRHSGHTVSSIYKNKQYFLLVIIASTNSSTDKRRTNIERTRQEQNRRLCIYTKYQTITNNVSEKNATSIYL